MVRLDSEGVGEEEGVEEKVEDAVVAMTICGREDRILFFRFSLERRLL